jgi:mRNA-degrading endonuclease toxin of MazEF toxin-antitoxin module
MGHFFEKYFWAGSGTSLTSSIMIAKLTTMPRCKLGEHIGRVSDTEVLVLSRGLVVFDGLV